MSDEPQATPAKPNNPVPMVLAGVAGLAAIVVIAVSCANGAVQAGKDIEAAAAPFTLAGELTLPSSGVFKAGAACTGTGGYDDIAEGAQVAVYDADGRVIARGVLREGVLASTDPFADCVFRFTVREVPAAEEILQVEVARRGKVLTSSWEAQAGPIKLNLGR